MRPQPFLLAIGYLLLAVPVMAEPWTQFKVKKAFISPETYQENRDTFSDPEFGWNVFCENDLIMRAGLYDLLFSPPCKGKIVLYFVERDVVWDDKITPFPVALQPEKQRLVDGEDEFEIQLSSYNPDSNSGPDSITPRILKDGEVVKDHVSFLDGDRTDTFACPAGITLLMRSSLSVQTEASALWTDDSQKLSRIDSKDNVRILSPPGFAVSDYTIACAGNTSIMLQTLSKLASEDKGLFRSARQLIDSNAEAQKYCNSNLLEPVCIYRQYMSQKGDRIRLENMRLPPAARAACNQAREDATYLEN